MQFSSTLAFARGNVATHPRKTDSSFRHRRGEHPANHPDRGTVVIVGGGVAGMRAAREVSRRGLSVVLFNGERRKPYDRTRLTHVLADEVHGEQLYQSDALGGPESRVVRHDGESIVRIDRDDKLVENAYGRIWHYAKLILCTGSRVQMPPIPGRDLPGVHQFQNFDDAETLIERARLSHRTLVVGGGLLGLEAARGMVRRGVETIVVEHEGRLMARQLDGPAGAILATQLADAGLGLRIGCSVRRISGFDRVEQATLSNGEVIVCDTVIMCVGLRCEIALARNAGLHVRRGITVNDAMQTSDPDIYAVGDCAEHDGRVYGLVSPGLEQAAAAAAHLAGEAGRYRGSTPATRLKLGGMRVFSIGVIGEGTARKRKPLPSIAWSDPVAGRYRRIVLRRGRVVGAVGVGDWPETARIEDTVRNRRFVWPWQRRRFARTGRLFGEVVRPVREWPAQATICSCLGVSRGRIGEAIRNGAASPEEVTLYTGAGGICGSCRPLVQELLGSETVPAPVSGAGTIAAASTAAFAAGLAVMLLPGWPVATSVTTGPMLDLLWHNGTVKQITGFTLFGLSAISALLPLRRRLGLTLPGRYALRRIVHSLSGAGLFGVLFLHTGFRVGDGPNFLLMTAFLAAIAAGAMTGLITARAHAFVGGGRGPRKLTGWLHILTLWPLPLLVGMHLVSVYAF